MKQPVRCERHKDVLLITMDDDKANAFGPVMIQALSEALDRAEREAKAVVVAGRPGVFCAGYDLKIMRGDDPDAVLAMRGMGRGFILRLYLHPQPVVIACTGHCLAAGALLSMTGDYRVGARGDYKIGLNETSIGLALPAFGLELARDRLHPGALSQATVGARIYDPDEALTVGYLDALADSGHVVDKALDTAAQMACLDGGALARTKRQLRLPTIRRIGDAIE